MRTVECHEPMIALKGLDAKIFLDASPENCAYIGYQPIFLAREAIALKLRLAVKTLPAGLGFLVKETLCPAELQVRFFEKYLHRLAKMFPEMNPEQRIEMASRFIAPPDVAGHLTGGAVDLTLCDLDGYALDMGCAYDADETTSNGACFSFCATIAPEAEKNRRILFSALETQGLINYPFEWWHCSYGDKYWAAISGSEYAIYGPWVNAP